MKDKNQKTVRGIIDVTRRGTGYLPCEPLEKDIEIPMQNLGTALNGDEVEVEITKRGKDRTYGRVVRVLERNREEFVGTLQEENGSLVLQADDPRMYARIRISTKDRSENAQAGFKALARIERWQNPRLDPLGSITRVLGRAGLHETEMQAAIAAHGFAADFPAEVLREADAIAASRTIPAGEIKQRRDFRSVPTFTIDPDDAKDFDDAISVQQRGEHVEIGIHIADVTYYVQPGSAIDCEARERATSIYLVDRTIPMLPEVLSNDICSLRPDEDRLTFSAVFVLDQQGAVQEQWFGRSIIRSQKRFTYREAQDVLERGSGPFTDELKTIRTLASTLRKTRMKNGSIAFDTDEVKFELSPDGEPLRAYVKERLETMQIIEDLMLLANREVAAYIAASSKNKQAAAETFIYRVHDAPNPERIEELRIFLRAIGYDLGNQGERVASKDINKLLKSIQGTPEETLIQMATLRSMAKAVYSHHNVGHFSLGFSHYTHFTSPIRRYADVMVHRILASRLKGEPIPKTELQAYRRAAIRASEREVEAVEAERDSVKFKQAEYMQKRIGQVFDGTVTGVAEFGIFIAEKETRAEGLVRLSALTDDYYDYDPKKYALTGKKTKRTFRLGDSVRIKLVSADPETRKIEWQLA